VAGLSKDEVRALTKEKASAFKKNLDEFVASEKKFRDDQQFMGMTDQEIVLNK